MPEIRIVYNGYQEIIKCNSNEKLEEIFNKFKFKLNVENKEIVYVYNNKIIIDENIIISQLTSEKIISILAYDSNNLPKNINNLLNSNYVICPKCKQSAILEEKDYKLIIYGCQNEDITDNILIPYDLYK